MLPTTTLILAAGRSRRFGRDKRLERIEGVPMLLRMALVHRSVNPNTVVVLGADDTQHAALLASEGIECLHFEHPDQGMGSTLAFAVQQYANSAGWLVSPADLPFIQVATIARVFNASVTHAIAAPMFQAQRGHPVWFGRQYLPELGALSGDQGARSVLLANRHDLHLIDVDDAGCVMDIDRPSDFASHVGPGCDAVR